MKPLGTAAPFDSAGSFFYLEKQIGTANPC